MPAGSDRRLALGEAARRVHDVEHEVRAAHLHARAPQALDLDHVVGVAQARGVHDVDRQAVDVDPLAQQVARRARDLGDDRRVVARERVQQGRLAGVRPARDHDVQPVAQRPALARRVRDRREALADLGEPVAHFLRLEELRVLVRKVDRRLDVGAQLHHAQRERPDLARELAGQRAQRRARRLGRSRGDEVGDRLRLHEVELAVVESALARTRRAAPGARRARRRARRAGP